MERFGQDKPILYMSEILELYKPAYQYNLMECRKGNYLGYIKFFLQCVIDQCNSFIYKMNEIDKIYKEDMTKMETMHSATLYKIMPIILSQVVFTKKELIEMTGLSKSTINRMIQKMEELRDISYDGSVRKKVIVIHVYTMCLLEKEITNMNHSTLDICPIIMDSGGIFL